MDETQPIADQEELVYIVDDDDSVRDSLALLLSTAGFRVRTYASCEEFIDKHEPCSRCCLILDMRLPRMSGLDLHRQLLEQGEDLPVIMITAYADVKTAVTAMKMRVFDFIEKPFDDTAIISSVRDAIASGAETGRRQAEHEDYIRHLQRLTGREHQVFELLIDGRTNKDIGRELDISPRTVEIHRARVMEKLEVRNLSELIRLAVESDLRN